MLHKLTKENSSQNDAAVHLQNNAESCPVLGPLQFTSVLYFLFENKKATTKFYGSYDTHIAGVGKCAAVHKSKRCVQKKKGGKVGGELIRNIAIHICCSRKSTSFGKGKKAGDSWW